jgi:hypothetical protein
MFKNWKTSLSGLAGIITGITLIVNSHVPEGITAIITGIGLISAKDYNKTGA